MATSRKQFVPFTSSTDLRMKWITPWVVFNFLFTLMGASVTSLDRTLNFRQLAPDKMDNSWCSPYQSDTKVHPPSGHAFCLKEWLIFGALEESARFLKQVYLCYVTHREGSNTAKAV